MRRAVFLFLLACDDDYTTLRIPPEKLDASAFEAESWDGQTEDVPDLEDGGKVTEARDGAPDASDAAACSDAGTSCFPGLCCSGLHCALGLCSSCKPKGYIALFASECCDPQTFSGGSCGLAQDKCGTPNYSGCMNGVTCCPGSACKWQGNYWQCACGIVDTPCTAPAQCCSGKCGSGGWCSP